MEIELPDGTVLEAPDDADIKKVVQGYRRRKLVASNPGEYDPKSPQFKAKYGPLAPRQVSKKTFGGGTVQETEDDTGTVGIGSGIKLGARKTTNFGINLMNKHPLIKALGGFPTPENATEKAIQEQEELDAPIGETMKGAAGQVLGQGVVAYGTTAPIGGLGGLSTAGSMLPRALAHPATRAALEGGVTGAASGEQGQMGTNALEGGLLSGAMDRAFAGAGRLVRGLVKKNEATEALQQLASQQDEDIFIPISQAAGDQDLVTKAARIAYGEGLSLIPGVKGQLQRQSEGAAEKVRELAIKEATPEGVHLPSRPGREVQESLASIRQGFDEAYDDTIRSLDFHIPKDLRKRLATQISEDAPGIDAESADKAMMLTRGLLRRFSNESPQIEGSGLLIVRDQLRKAAEKAPDYERPAFVASAKVVDDMIKQRLQVQGLYGKFADLEEPARHLRGLESAAHAARANSGRFSPAQLARSAKDDTQRDLGQTAGEALSGSAAGTSFAGRSLLGGASMVGLGATAGPAAAAGALIGANLLATKTAQKALMGDTAAQRAIVDLLKKHPEAADAVKRALEQAAVTEMN